MPDGTIEQPTLESHRQRLRTAIALIEQDYLDDDDFKPPSDEPETPTGYVWLRVVSGAGAIGGIVDFLKPIVSLQSALFFFCVIGAVACHAALRVWPSWQRWLRWGRRLGAAVAVSVLVFFGLATALPGAEPNGVIAEAIPPLQRLQQALLEQINQAVAAIDTRTKTIDATTRRTDLTVGHIDRRTEGMAGDLATLAKKSDPVEAAKEIVIRAGYSPDTDGLIRAILDDNAVKSDYSSIGIELTEESIFRSLQDKPWDREQVHAFAEFMRLSSGSIQKNFRMGIDSFVNDATTRKGYLNLTNFQIVACGGKLSGLFNLFVQLQLKSNCGDSLSWYLSMLNILSEFSVSSDAVYYIPTKADLISLDDFDTLYTSAKPRFIELRLPVALIENNNTLVVRRAKLDAPLAILDYYFDPVARDAVFKCIENSGVQQCLATAYYFHENDVTKLIAVTDFTPR